MMPVNLITEITHKMSFSSDVLLTWVGLQNKSTERTQEAAASRVTADRCIFKTASCEASVKHSRSVSATVTEARSGSSSNQDKQRF